jgi:hypothetical protein
MAAAICDVRFTLNSGHSLRQSECLLWAKSGHDAYQTFLELEPLSALLTLRIGKIAVERKADVLRQRVDAKMISLGWLAALSHMVEGPVKLGQIFDFNH